MLIACEKKQNKRKKRYEKMKNAVSLETVHTHTHTHK